MSGATESFRAPGGTIGLPGETLAAEAQPVQVRQTAELAAPRRRLGSGALFWGAVLGAGALFVAAPMGVTWLKSRSQLLDSVSIPMPKPIILGGSAQTAPDPEPDPAPSRPALDRPSAPLPQTSSNHVVDDIASIGKPGAREVGVGAPPPSSPNAPQAQQAPTPVGTPTLTVTPTPPAAPAPPAPPLDPVSAALAMTPAPTTPAEEIKLLNLVTQIATQIRDMGEQNAGLREQVTSMRSSFTSRLDDLERRISLNEATQAVKGMRGGEPEQAVQPRPTPTPAPRNAEEPVALAPGGLSGAGVGVPVADWKVEGASPRMVVLGAASGGPPKIVKLGEEIDGRYGKVTKITQNATSGRWTVFAERGALVQGGR